MSRRRARHDAHEEHENHERWLITYADMITLLMAFFIMLFAMSQLDLAKFASFKRGVQSHFGGNVSPALDGGTGMHDASAPPRHPADAAANDPAEPDVGGRLLHDRAVQTERRAMADVEGRVTAALAAQGLAGSVRFRQEGRGLVVSVVADSVLFELGSAELRPAGRLVLDAVSNALQSVPNRVAVEGHTDDLPITGGPYPSNWELSTARATSVLRYLAAAHRLPASRLSAAGYADQRPLVPNDSADHRARNRRVEVVVLSQLAN